MAQIKPTILLLFTLQHKLAIHLMVFAVGNHLKTVGHPVSVVKKTCNIADIKDILIGKSCVTELLAIVFRNIVRR